MAQCGLKVSQNGLNWHAWVNRNWATRALHLKYILIGQEGDLLADNAYWGPKEAMGLGSGDPPEGGLGRQVLELEGQHQVLEWDLSLLKGVTQPGGGELRRGEAIILWGKGCFEVLKKLNKENIYAIWSVYSYSVNLSKHYKNINYIFIVSINYVINYIKLISYSTNYITGVIKIWSRYPRKKMKHAS